MGLHGCGHGCGQIMRPFDIPAPRNPETTVTGTRADRGGPGRERWAQVWKTPNDLTEGGGHKCGPNGTWTTPCSPLTPLRRARAWATGSLSRRFSSTLLLLAALLSEAERAVALTSAISILNSSSSGQMRRFVAVHSWLVPRSIACTASSYRSKPMRARACLRYGLCHWGCCGGRGGGRGS